MLYFHWVFGQRAHFIGAFVDGLAPLGLRAAFTWNWYHSEHVETAFPLVMLMVHPPSDIPHPQNPHG
jgi:hypothetical protein